MEKVLSNEALKNILHDVCVCEGYVEGLNDKVKGEALKAELESFLFRLQTAHKSLYAYLVVKRGDTHQKKYATILEEWMNEFKKCLLDSSEDYLKELMTMIKKAHQQLSTVLKGANMNDPQLHRMLHILYDDYAAAIYCFDRYLVTMEYQGAKS